MPLTVNSRLGPYEIRSMLGAGGMGEVYRARDFRLNRDVAIKVLRENGAASADQRSRFEREARAVARLNHPNIVGVYDFGVEAGQQYIVSELVEGRSLRALLTGNPIQVRKLLDIATQVADGLAAAHTAGFIHRDLKPENIMLARDGRIKILDFGLARQAHAPDSQAATIDSEETSAPAVGATKPVTREGAVLGTANYMSPEQATGKEVSCHTDQFSFGLVLYELASGKQAFARASTIETMAAIVREEPPAMEEELPAPLMWIIDRCLQKESEQRYESTRDLFRELKDLRDHFSEAYWSGVQAPIATLAKRRRWRIPVAAGASCLLLGGLLVYLLRPVGQTIGNYRYRPFASDASISVWSPDGKAVVYAGKVKGTDQVFLRYLDSPVPVQLTYEKRSVWPLGWSADRNHLIFGENTDRTEPPFYKLYSVATVGGEPDFIMDFDCNACDLSRDSKALAALARNKEGVVGVEVSDPLGSPLRAYSPAPFESKTLASIPDLGFSPDGKRILIFRVGDYGKHEAWLLPYPAGGKPPQRILQKLPIDSRTPSFSWMPDNRHILLSLGPDQNSPRHLWMADTESNELTPLTTGSADEWGPAVSPDGKSVVYLQSESHWDVVSVSLQDGSTKTLIGSGREESMAAWSGRQTRLAWVTDRNGLPEVWVRLADGSDRTAVTAADFPPGTSKRLMNPSLSPDGDRLVFGRIDQEGAVRLWISSLSGGSPVLLTNANLDMEFGGSWSQDGSRFAYVANRAGKPTLMIVRTSGNAAPVKLRDMGQRYDVPDWSPTGDWITYIDDKGWNLVSPDGERTKFLVNIETYYLAFSKDGKLLYGVQTGETEADQDRATLFSLDPVSLKLKVIKELGKDLVPSSNFRPGIRFSMAPDGKSLVYAIGKRRSDLWLLQGYRQPGWLGQFSAVPK